MIGKHRSEARRHGVNIQTPRARAGRGGGSRALPGSLSGRKVTESDAAAAACSDSESHSTPAVTV